MRRAVLIVAGLTCALAALAGGGVPGEEYQARRAAARKTLGRDVLVLRGNSEGDAEEARIGFVQEPNFYYLTGWREPNAILLMTESEEVLFLPARNPVMERYTGPKTAPDDTNASAVTGFARVLPVKNFADELKRVLKSHKSVVTLTSRPNIAELKKLAPKREFVDAVAVLAKQRELKSAAEIALIQRSMDATVEAHRAAWRRIAAGLYEYQVAATMTFSMTDGGCERNAYSPIVASGLNATVLHYAANTRQMKAGEMLLMDVGAECNAYTADVTRTVPVDGKFTARQRELYEIVLGAEKALIAMVKPGMVMGTKRDEANSLYKAAVEYFDAHGKDAKGEGLGKYLTHGVSHHVGLEVHDAPRASYSAPLQVGMVITIEPGLYIPEEGIGIRIEDTVVLTADGAKVLGSALPREPGEIEEAMAKR